jgi:hypothetical protein
MAAPTSMVAGPSGTSGAPNGSGTSLVPAAKAASAGTTLVATARVGRIVGRSYLRLARQLPGVSTLEREAGKLTRAVVDRAAELMDEPPAVTGSAVYASADEQRVLRQPHNADREAEPLRSAMSRLLSRSTGLTSGRQYLFASIVAQLVPDEARILAALADNEPFAVIDVEVKASGRGTTRTARTVLANASTLGRVADVRVTADAAAYLTRLFRFGLVDFGPADGRLADEYDEIAADETVRRARAAAEAAKQGTVRHHRKTVTLSDLGREFWAATAPSPLPR